MLRTRHARDLVRNALGSNRRVTHGSMEATPTRARRPAGRGMAGAVPPCGALAALTCSLTQDLFVEPVLYLAPNDGATHIYERAALEQWLTSLGIDGADRGRLVPVAAVRVAVEAAVARGEAPLQAREAWTAAALAAAARAALTTHDLGPLRRVVAASSSAGDALSKAGAALFVEGLPEDLKVEAESILEAPRADVTQLQARVRGVLERQHQADRIAFARRWSARRERQTATPRSTRRISWDPELPAAAPFPSPPSETPHRDWPLHEPASAPASPDVATRGRFRVSRADMPQPPPTPPPKMKRPFTTPPQPPARSPRSLSRFEEMKRAARASEAAARTLQRWARRAAPPPPPPAESPLSPASTRLCGEAFASEAEFWAVRMQSLRRGKLARATAPAAPVAPTGRRAHASMAARSGRRTLRTRASGWASSEGAEACAAAAAGHASAAVEAAQAAAQAASTAADAAEAIGDIVGALMDTVAPKTVAPIAMPEAADESAPGPATPPARPAKAPHARPAKSPRPDEVVDVSYTESELAVLCTPAAATATRELAGDAVSAARELKLDEVETPAAPRPSSGRRSRSPWSRASPLRCATSEAPKDPGPKPALPPRPKKISPRCITMFPPAEESPPAAKAALPGSPPAAKGSLPLVLPGGRKLPPVF